MILELIKSLVLGALVVMVIWHHTILKELEGEHEMRCEKCANVGTCPAAFSWNVKFPCAEYKEEKEDPHGKEK